MLWKFISERMSLFEEAWFSDSGQRHTYGEVLACARLCGGKLKEGLRVKAKCAVLCSSNYNTAMAILGCWFADMLPIPMSVNYGEKHCKKIIEGTRPEVIISDTPEINGVYGVPSFDLRSLSFTGDIVPQDQWELLQDVALIMNTSGTTGNPKGAMITETGLLLNILAIDEYFKIEKGDNILIARPLYHCAVLTGEFLISLYKGLNIVFLDGIYNPISVLNCIAEQKITVLCGTPTLFQHLSIFSRRLKKAYALKVLAISGECLTGEIARQIREVFKEAYIYNVYGLTEASPRVSYLEPGLFDSIPESVGKGLQNTKIKIADDLGNELQPNQHGNVWVSSPSIMKGYYGNEALTRQKIKGDWLLTGDVGYKDIAGNLYILARVDDMIIKAGMNIYPKEIENVLNELPMVKENMAYGVLEGGVQAIAVDIVLKEGIQCSEKELMAEISRALPSYQLPSQINITDSLNRNASGKLVRTARAALY